MYIWTAILVATIGLLTSVCANGHEPELELMPKTALDEYLEIGANLPSDFPSVERDFQDNAIQDNDQDKTEAKPRDDFTRAQTEIQAHRGWNKERESTSPTLDLQISSKTHSDANLVPTLDSVDVLVPSSDGYFIKHKHLDSHVVIKVVRVWREFILPITSTTLTGQQLLWNHANEDLVEEYVGVEFYPPVIQHFAGIFVVKRINGVLKRLMAFNYESLGKRFSYEPDMIYVERNAEKLYERITSIHIGTTINQGIRQVLFEVARTPEGQQNLYLNLVIVADNSVFRRFRNVTSSRNLPIEESISSASSYLLELEDMLHWTPLVTTKKHVLYGTISEVRVCTNPEVTPFLQRSTSTKGTIDGQRALSFYKLLKPLQTQMTNPNHVVVVLTRDKIQEDDLVVSGVHSSGLNCQGSIIIVTHEELHGTGEKIRNHLRKMLVEGETVEADSVDSILDKLRRGPTSCLEQQAVQLREGLGPQELDVNVQCQLVFGNDFVACRSSQGEMCSSLTCRTMTDKDEDNTCITMPQMKTLPRTPCEDGKLCKKGICSSDVSAPRQFEWPLETRVPSEDSPSCPDDKLTIAILCMTSVLTLMVAALCALVCKNVLISKEVHHKRDE